MRTTAQLEVELQQRFPQLFGFPLEDEIFDNEALIQTSKQLMNAFDLPIHKSQSIAERFEMLGSAGAFKEAVSI